VAWHAAYDDPSSSLSARLRCVRSHLSDAIDRAPAGLVNVVSLCAGQGHDVIGVLPQHPRRDDVRAVLVESDARNVALARQAAAARGLSRVEVRHADASLVAGFADALPADVLLLCGIFGNVSDRDIRRTVHTAAALCRVGATVIWTRHRRPPDLTLQIRAWFAGARPTTPAPRPGQVPAPIHTAGRHRRGPCVSGPHLASPRGQPGRVRDSGPGPGRPFPVPAPGTGDTWTNPEPPRGPSPVATTLAAAPADLSRQSPCARKETARCTMTRQFCRC
jgi:hypothetical protein